MKTHPTTSIEKMEKEKEEKRRPWSDLPQEILEPIKKQLHFTNQLTFSTVCKSWSSIDFFPPPKQLPWLITIYKPEWNSFIWTCKLIDPTSKKTFLISNMKAAMKNKIKDFSTMKVHESKFGWLLISSQIPYTTTTSTSLFLFSPFCNQKNNVIELPVLNYSNISMSTFTSSPLEKDCEFLTVTSHSQTNGVVVVSRCSPGAKKWRSSIYTVGRKLGGIECWTYSQGMLYGASREIVARLDLDQNTWFKFPSQPSVTNWYDGGKLHIMKTDGNNELFLIFERNLRRHDKIMFCHFGMYSYGLDLWTKIWKRVVNLGDGVMFIGDGYKCVSKIDGISHKLYYTSWDLELGVYSVDGINVENHNCYGDYGLIPRDCRKLWIDTPSTPLH